jgi:hypothetical protein
MFYCQYLGKDMYCTDLEHEINPIWEGPVLVMERAVAENLKN